jgi:hypothetical protein
MEKIFIDPHAIRLHERQRIYGAPFVLAELSRPASG